MEHSTDDTTHPIEAWLDAHHLTQRWLAGQVGISEPFLSQIIKGRRQPSIDVAAAIEAITGVPPRELVLKESA